MGVKASGNQNEVGLECVDAREYLRRQQPPPDAWRYTRRQRHVDDVGVGNGCFGEVARNRCRRRQETVS